MKRLYYIGVICLVILFIAQSRNMAEAKELYPPSSDFNRHSIVQLVLLHKRTKREIATTRDMSGSHHLEVTLKVPIDGQEYILDLSLNQDLVPDNHILSYQENNKTVLHKPKKEEMDLCHYGGSVRGKPGSWVAVSTCHGVQGVVFDGERMRYIEPAQGGDVNTKHYIYDQSDLTESTLRRCGNEDTNNTLYNSYESKTTRYKRDASGEEPYWPFETYRANQSSLYVELVLVADKRHYEAHNRDVHSVHKQMKTIANILNSIYSSLNIFIVLVGVKVWTDNDLIRLEGNTKTILENFSYYRHNTLVREIPNDNAHLITHKKFENDVIGSGNVGRMCTLGSSAGIANYHTNVVGQLAMTIAHEMGHNFGMKHDEEKDKNGDERHCKCQGKKCIMSKSSSSEVHSRWSSCTLSSMALTFARGMGICLRNKPKRLLDSATCGNGLVELGEECDCGTKARGAHNPCHRCCDPNTCQHRANATCGAGECCDLQTCRHKPMGTLCRSADRYCDLPEYCTGRSEHCPDDVYKMDTTPCGKDEQSAYCVGGECSSRQTQCRQLWGPTGESCPNQVYDYYNRIGDWAGDCGFDRLRGTYKKCTERNTLCGRLQCIHHSKANSMFNYLEFGAGDSISNVLWQDRGKYISCHAASIDLGLDVVDFGLVPDGAKCGEEMMCLKQKCESIAAVRQRIALEDSSVCPSNCSGHGVCNSKGHCHCDPGFSPPLCEEPGPGGSYDSEPATDQTSLINFKIAMYVIFLGIVPAIVLVLLIIYCCRQNSLAGCKKYKPNLGFKPTNSTNNNTIGQDCTIYANIATVRSSSTIHTSIAAVSSPSMIYANIEEITARNTKNHKTIPLVLPLKGVEKSNIQVINSGGQAKPMVKPFSREIRPKLREANSEVVRVKLPPLVRPKPISNELARELQANAQVANSRGLQIKPLVKPKPNLNNSSEGTRRNVQVSKVVNIKQLAKPTLNLNESSKGSMKPQPQQN